MRRKKRAQSTMEYALLFAGVTVAILYGISQMVTPKAEAQMDAAGGVLSKATTELQTATGTNTGTNE